MSNLQIKTHNFETAMSRIKSFSQKESEELEIDSVSIDGGFLGLGDHRVRGHELNSRLRTVQEHLIGLNDTNNKTIKEFGEVYRALEALDKNYIQAIINNIKASEINSISIKDKQKSIEKLTSSQEKTLQILLKFKGNLDKLNHIKDIDKIWEKTNMLLDNFEKLKKQVDVNIEYIEQSQSNINELLRFLEKIDDIEHLEDIDLLWESNYNNSKELSKLEKENEEIKKLIDDTKIFIERSKVEADENTHNLSQDFSKKIKFAYILAGGSLGIALIEMIIIFLKVI